MGLTPEQELSRAVSAEQILKNPLVSEAFTEIEKEIVERIALLSVNDALSREKLCMMLSASRIFKSVFEAHIQTGKMAEIQLKDKKGIFKVF